jgi:Cu/Ag efflux pump CusA
MNTDKNKLFAIKFHVSEFKDAQWRTIYSYEEKIENVLHLVIPITLIVTIVLALFLVSETLVIFSLCLGIPFLLYIFILQGTKIMRLISKGTAYLLFGNKIDEKIVKVKDDARLELFTLSEAVKAMPDYGDWKTVKEQSLDIINYKLV